MHFPEVLAALLLELLAVQQFDHIAVAGDDGQRSAQVVRNAVIEGLQLNIRGFQFRGAGGEIGVQNFELFLQLPARRDIDDCSSAFLP